MSKTFFLYILFLYTTDDVYEMDNERASIAQIIDIVRKYNKPIRYFAYASATKCAEQVVLEDQKRVKGS